jgi:hypothetical protein
MKRRALLILALALIAKHSRAGDAVQLTFNRDMPVNKGIAEKYGKKWMSVQPWAYFCPVAEPTSGKHILTVMTVDIIGADKDGFFKDHIDEDVPLPLVLLEPSGPILGELPEGFPNDPPGRLQVYFSEWTEGFPHRIDFFEAGTSALPPHRPPFHLAYNSKAGRFEEKDESA